MKKVKSTVSFSAEPLGFAEFLQFIGSWYVIEICDLNQYADAEIYSHTPMESVDLDRVQIRTVDAVFPELHPSEYSSTRRNFTDQLCNLIQNSGQKFLPSSILTALFKKGEFGDLDFTLRQTLPDTWHGNSKVYLPLLGTLYQIEKRWYDLGEKSPSVGKFCLGLVRRWGHGGPPNYWKPYWTVTVVRLSQRAMDGYHCRIPTIE